MNTQDFIKQVNALRLANKGNWYTWQGIVNGKNISLKGHNTWLQILLVDGVQYGNCANKTVKDFKTDLYNAVN